MTTLEKGVFWTPSFDVLEVELQEPEQGSPRITALGALEGHLICGTLEGKVFAVDAELEVDEFVGKWQHPGLLGHASLRNGRMMLGEYDVWEEEGKVQFQIAEDYRFQSVRMELAI